MAIDRRPGRPKPWRARYWGPDGRQHSRSFERKAEAQRWLAEVAHDKTRGHWTNPALGRVRFSAWVGEWQQTTSNVRPTTAVRDRMLLDRYLLPRFGPLPLASIGQRDVRAWITELSAKGAGPGDGAEVLSGADQDSGRRCRGGHAPSLAVPWGSAAQG
jgi:integrase-like protein